MKRPRNIPELLDLIEGGVQGPKGDIGPQGPIGLTGSQGETGPKGDKGNVGAKGDKGDKGDTGPQGEVGPKGDKGEIGPQGPIGLTGPKGDKGDIGAIDDTGWIDLKSYTDSITFPGTYDCFLARRIGNLCYIVCRGMRQFSGDYRRTAKTLLNAGLPVNLRPAVQYGAAIMQASGTTLIGDTSIGILAIQHAGSGGNLELRCNLSLTDTNIRIEFYLIYMV